ncbi:hypothetical protein J6590_040736 [Homalodisca vitripennis]|nr:hypothetical protein J6590_040736 [Homalodisca vitripennis]
MRLKQESAHQHGRTAGRELWRDRNCGLECANGPDRPVLLGRRRLQKSRPRRAPSGGTAGRRPAVSRRPQERSGRN